VRREWRYARSLRRKDFIRATYWTDPKPELPAALKGIKFAFVKLRATPSVDVGIIVALKEEARELLSLAGKHTPRDDGEMNSYLFARGGYRCIVTLVGAMGETEAARVTERHIGLFDPKCVVSIGISGGVHGDLRVGDVYVPPQVVQYMQDAKASPKGAGGFVLLPAATASRADDKLHTVASGFDLNHAAAYQTWREEGRKDLEALLPDSAVRERLFTQDLVRRDVEILTDGHEASGPVVSAAAAFSTWIRSHDRNIKAIDMESAAVLRTSEARKDPPRGLVIRGISDYGDPRKQDLDAIGGGSLRKYAMRNAARFLFALLDSGALPHRPR
jgi:nucleoside phosphorylase